MPEAVNAVSNNRVQPAWYGAAAQPQAAGFDASLRQQSMRGAYVDAQYVRRPGYPDRGGWNWNPGWYNWQGWNWHWNRWYYNYPVFQLPYWGWQVWWNWRW